MTAEVLSPPLAQSLVPYYLLAVQGDCPRAIQPGVVDVTVGPKGQRRASSSLGTQQWQRPSLQSRSGWRAACGSPTARNAVVTLDTARYIVNPMFCMWIPSLCARWGSISSSTWATRILWKPLNSSRGVSQDRRHTNDGDDTKMIQFQTIGVCVFGDSNVITFRQARAQSVLSVRELAARAGVAPTTVYQIEHGLTRPHYRSIRALSGALGVDPMQIEEFARVIEEGGADPASNEPHLATTSRRKR
jgi:DNA-binding XRE family transcriptional regulator